LNVINELLERRGSDGHSLESYALVSRKAIGLWRCPPAQRTTVTQRPRQETNVAGGDERARVQVTTTRGRLL
jgi:hypothetical protein